MTFTKTTQTPATTENVKWLRIRVRKQTQNPDGVDSGTPDPWPSLLQTYQNRRSRTQHQATAW